MDNLSGRIDAVIDVLARASVQDFSKPVPLPDKEDEFVAIEVGVNTLLDDLSLSQKRNREQLRTIEEKNREIAEHQAMALRELDTPIIAVWRGVLALPVIGTVDTERSASMMDKLLGRITDDQARFVIIDITGVSVLDTRTADHFIRMAKAVRLLGAECFLTGISPAIAQTMAQLGVDTSNVRTLRRLSDALGLAFVEMGVVHEKAGF